MLFAPEKVGGNVRLRAEHPELTELQKRLEAAVELCRQKLCLGEEREQSERASQNVLVRC